MQIFSLQATAVDRCVHSDVDHNNSTCELCSTKLESHGHTKKWCFFCWCCCCLPLLKSEMNDDHTEALTLKHLFQEKVCSIWGRYNYRYWVFFKVFLYYRAQTDILEFVFVIWSYLRIWLRPNFLKLNCVNKKSLTWFGILCPFWSFFGQIFNLREGIFKNIIQS